MEKEYATIRAVLEKGCIPMKYRAYVYFFLFICLSATAEEKNSTEKIPSSVKITPTLAQVEVIHNGKPFIIKRNQDGQNTIKPDYAKTSRPCPPFCLQPHNIGIGVETIGELELLDYLEKAGWGEEIIIIDTRAEHWLINGTIPGSINIPATRLDLEQGGNILDIKGIITEKFGVAENQDLLDFTAAKTLVLFCNGVWCGQSSGAIKTLLRLGYPAHKLKWYRGGIQAWENVGLSVVIPKETAVAGKQE